MAANARHQVNDTLTPRTYQLEMLEQSLKQNIIVAVRTIARDLEPNSLADDNLDGYGLGENKHVLLQPVIAPFAYPFTELSCGWKQNWKCAARR